MLALVGTLIEQLNRRGVRYCHWKSNAALAEALQGGGDLDLLVERAEWGRFEAALGELGFVEAALAGWQRIEGIHHYFGLDEGTGRLVHLHVYDRLITGGTLLKNHALPLAEMLFEGVRDEQGVPVPCRAAELALLVLRKTVESASPLEHALMLREHEHVRRELTWLLAGGTLPAALALLRKWLPEVDTELFERCVAALESKGAIVERFRLGRQLSRALRAYQVRPTAVSGVERCYRLGRWLVNVFVRRRPGLRLFRGALIAIVGPEGSGKSTLVEEVGRWLGREFEVHRVHAGKPPSSVLTALPNAFLPLLRRAAPGSRTGSVELGSAGNPTKRRGPGFWLYLVRCIALAYDRWRLLANADRLRAGGAIVVSDRYPTPQLGAVDGTQVDAAALVDEGRPWAARLARLERSLYGRLPTPDLVLRCSVPLELALHRNATREKAGGPEPEEYVRRRHEQLRRMVFPRSRVEAVDTSRSLEETLRDVRRLVWGALTERTVQSGRVETRAEARTTNARL